MPSNFFIIDTNFFISMEEFNRELWLRKLGAMKSGNKDVSFDITVQILSEMPFIRGGRKKEFETVVNVHKVSESDIGDLKVKMNEKNPAQDPDLTLLFLADKISKKGTAWLVSDDFKLVENTERFNNKIKILTPGSFLLKLTTLTEDSSLRRFFKSMEKKVTDYSIKYILSRQDIYPAAKKLSWLVDRTAALVGSGDIELEESGKAVADIVRAKTAYISSTSLPEDDLMKVRLADIYLTGLLTLSKDQQTEIEPLVDYLDILKSYISRLNDAKGLILEEDYEAARIIMEDLDEDILNTLIKARFDHQDAYNILYVITAIQIYKITFFKAYICLSRGDVLAALSCFTETAFWAMQGQQDAALLNVVYMKAMLFLFNFSDNPDFYIKAIENYEYARFLAEKIGDEEMQLKCLLAKAIASYQVERVDDAKDYITLVQEISMKKPEAAANAFAEMGDFFLSFGKPEYSVFLYDEALEAAIVSGIEHKNKSLLDSMKKSYIIAGVKMQEIVKGGLHLDALIDESFNIMDKNYVDKYNEQIMNLAQFNSLMYEPFPFVYKNWTKFIDIDESLKDEYDLIDVEVMGGSRSRISVYSSTLGLIAFVVPKAIELVGPVEAYSLSLTSSANVKISQVKGDLFNEKLLRALIYVKEENDIAITRRVPSFLRMS